MGSDDNLSGQTPLHCVYGLKSGEVGRERGMLEIEEHTILGFI